MDAFILLLQAFAVQLHGCILDENELDICSVITHADARQCLCNVMRPCTRAVDCEQHLRIPHSDTHSLEQQRMLYQVMINMVSVRISFAISPVSIRFGFGAIDW